VPSSVGEAYNFYMTAKTSVATQDEVTTPLLEKMQKHKDAVDQLRDIEAAAPSTLRLTAARQALADAKTGGESQRVRDAEKALRAAQDAADKEAQDGCRTVCKQKQGEATKARFDLAAAIAAAAEDRKADITAAQREVTAAIVDAEAKHAAAVEMAKKDVEANPLPPSSTSLSDRTGLPPWALDLMEALLKSLGVNIMAATLIAYGAHRPVTDGEKDSDGSDNAQTDFNPVAAEAAIRFFRPDPPNPDRGGPDRPKKPGPSGGKSKAEALDDLMQRLADGRTIGSQDELASDWNRPKQTVSDWMREWRRIGVIPAATPTGRCKATVAG
jgi:hypothetical protein